MHLLNVKSDRVGRYGKTQNETEKNQAIEHWKNNNKTSEKKHEEKKKHNVLNEKKETNWTNSLAGVNWSVNDCCSPVEMGFFFVKTLNRIRCRYEYKNLVTPDQSKQKTKFICSFSGKRRLNLLFVYCLHTVNRVCSNIRKLLFLFWIVVHSHHKLMHFQCCYRKKETHILSTYWRAHTVQSHA